jgi:hypothetical protein
LGFGHEFHFHNEKILLLPSFHIDGRLNSGDIGGISGYSPNLTEHFFIDIRSKSGFHIVPDMKTKFSLKLTNNFKFFVTIGYMYSFNKSIDIAYEIYNDVKKIASGSGYFTGTNWYYGFGLSFNPKILNK